MNNKNLKLSFQNLILIFIIIVIFNSLINYEIIFQKKNFFLSFEEDIFSLFDYRINNDLTGWRFNTGLGQSFLGGDPSFNSWSIINIIFNLPFEDKEYLYNLIYLILCSYCCFSIFLILNLISKNKKRKTNITISLLYSLASFKYEFFYSPQWMLIGAGISLSILILYKFFQEKNSKYIYLHFANLFILFHFGGSITIQQVIGFSLIFTLIYMYYFKLNIIKLYFKITLSSLFLLTISSLWIFYPAIDLSLSDDYERSSNYVWPYFNLDLKQFFSDLFNIFFGNLFNKKGLLFPDKNLIPNFNWYQNLPIIINVIFITILLKKKKNFWEFFIISALLIYTIHALLCSLLPIYGAINTAILPIYPWSKVFVEIFVLQIMLFQNFFLNFKFELKKDLKIYLFLLNIIFILYLIILLNLRLNANFLDKIFTYLSSSYFENDNKIIIEILREFFFRLNYISDFYLIFYIFSTVVLINLTIFCNLKKIKKYFILIFILATFFSSKHFSSLDKDGSYVWSKIMANKIFDISDRFILINDSNHYNLNLKNITNENFNDWKNRHRTNNKDYYGYRSPPANSFSRITSFNSKSFSKLILGDKRNAFTNYRNIQFPNIDSVNFNLMHNLAINYIISKDNLKKFNNKLSEFTTVYAAENIYIYKNNSKNLYYYFPKKLILEDPNKFLNTKITTNYAYIESNYEYLTLFEYNQKTDIKKIKIENGKIELDYFNDKNSFFVISDLSDKNWKANIGGEKIKIYNVNFFFKGVELPPGNHTLVMEYDNNKYKISILISIIIIIILLFVYLNKYQFKNHI